MELEGVLSIFQKKCFDRTSQDAATLAAFLCSQRGFFGGMQQDVVELLCKHIGHAHVEEGAHVFKQGQLGDCMYIVLKGYCSVLKHPQQSNISSNGAQSYSSSGNRRCTDSNSGTHSSSANGSQPASRRATMEQQVQQFALATAAMGGSRAASCALSNHQHGLNLSPAVSLAAAAVGVVPDILPDGAMGKAYRCSAGARRCTADGQAAGPGGAMCLSRRATAEQHERQLLAEAVHVGWVGEGESFGEAALLSPDKPRPVTIVAGDGGVVLAMLDRAAYNRLQAQAKSHQGNAAAALHSVLAAAAKPLLQVAPNKRTAEDIESLADLLAGLEAFKSLPQPVRTKLAKSCQAVSLPAGAIVFEEDQKGDAMYVVMSGSCQVRARPLKDSATSAAADEYAAELIAGAAVVAQTGEQAPMAVAGTDSSRSNSRRSTAERPAVSGAGANAAGQVLLRNGSSVKRTTWEGVAFTAQEQAKIEAIKAELDAKKQAGQPEGTTLCQPDKNVERDGVYWTAKYMSDAMATASGADPHWGLEGGLTPLAAVFVAKWRQQMRQQQAEHETQQQEQEQADKAYTAMEEMLGKAAAKAWRAARDAALNSTPQSPSAAAAAGTADAATEVNGTSTKCAFTPKQVGSEVAKFSRSSSNRSAGQASGELTVTAVGLSARSSSGGSSSSSTTPRAAGNAATVAAAGLLAAAAAAADPAEALKLQLAAVGVNDPAAVSRSLLEEVAQRADLNWLLATVASQLEAKGLPRRLSKKSSLKITRELNKRMLGGASWKGYGNSKAPQEQQQQDSTEPAAGGRAVAFAGDTNTGMRSSRAMRASLGDDTASELGTEFTGQSSWDLHSSMDGSEAGSLYCSLDADDGPADAAVSTSGCGISRSAAVNASGEDGNSKTSSTTYVTKSASASGGVPPLTAGAVPRWPGVLNVAENPQGTSQPQLTLEQYEEQYGPVIRTLRPGESFGELALLNKAAIRTATVVVTPVPAAETLTAVEGAAEGQEPAQVSAAGAPSGMCAGALLIRISRSTYDATVRSLQVAALEDLLGFLSSVAPFRALSRGLLTSLAVYARPQQYGTGEMLVMAGQSSTALIIIQEGDVKLLDTPAAASTSKAAASGTASPALPPSSRRTTAEAAALGADSASLSSSSAGSAAAAAAASAETASSRTVIRQLSRKLSLSQQQQNAAVTDGVDVSSSGSAMKFAGGAMFSALGLSRVQQSSTPLAVLGAGSLLGENALGYNAEQDPLQAIAAAKGHKARQAAMAAASALTHNATAVAATPCRVLVISAPDLRRFGRRVRAPLAQLAADRRQFLQQRRTAVQDTKLCIADMMSDMRHQIDKVALAAVSAASADYATTSGGSASCTGTGAAAGAAKLPPTSRHTSSNGSCNYVGMYSQDPYAPSNSVYARMSSSGVLPGSAAHDAAALGAFGKCSLSGTVPSGSMTNVLRRTISNNSNGVSRPSVSEWQQQQWQQQAFGELLTPQPAVQQLTAGEVARLKQVVPSSQAPCVSELAAAARVFPVGALNATTSAPVTASYESNSQLIAPGSIWKGLSGTGCTTTLGKSGNDTCSASLHSGCCGRTGGSAAGLKLSISSQSQNAPAMDVVESPAWTIQAGGAVTAATQGKSASSFHGGHGAAALAAAAESVH